MYLLICICFICLQAKAVSRDKYISKMFLRGDSVILVVKNPKEAVRQQPPAP